ncbi:hypothetical protein DQG13_02295 [Paenibacillus sp. YN15]|nr:hypothetical protein DQG13_02295 [Paenibacillus sp. YN15]
MANALFMKKVCLSRKLIQQLTEEKKQSILLFARTVPPGSAAFCVWLIYLERLFLVSQSRSLLIPRAQNQLS